MTNLTRLLWLLALLFVAGCGLLQPAGQLDPAAIKPAVDLVTARYDAWVEAGVLPDGQALTEAQRMAWLATSASLRQTVDLAAAQAAAVAQPVEPESTDAVTEGEQ